MSRFFFWREALAGRAIDDPERQVEGITCVLDPVTGLLVETTRRTVLLSDPLPLIEGKITRTEVS